MIARREFMTLLGGAAAAWPTAARAQQAAMPVIGFLDVADVDTSRPTVAAFLNGLKGQSYAVGQNVRIEFRGASDDYDRLPALAAELVQHPVSLIVAVGARAILAAKAATSTIRARRRSGRRAPSCPPASHQ